MRIPKIYFMLSLCCAGLLGACTDNTENPTDQTLVSDVPLLRYRVEQTANEPEKASTRQVAEEKEKTVSDLTLLFFNKDRNEEGVYRGMVTLRGITNQDAENTYFNQPLDMNMTGAGIPETGDYDVLVLANSQNISGLKVLELTGKLQTNTTKLRDAKDMLVYNYSDFKPAGPFLMSAQGTYTAASKVIEVNLRRVVAKVRIKASRADADFIIETMQFGNSRTQTYVADLDGDYPPTISADYVGEVSTEGNTNTEKKTNQYSKGLSGYVFETYSNVAEQSDKTTLCVILGVKLATDQYAAIHYFRYNLNVRSSGTQRIYRNAYYEYTVSGFSSAGFNTPDEAINSSRRDVLVMSSSSWDDAEGGAFGYAPDGKMVQVDKYAITKRFIDLKNHPKYPGVNASSNLTQIQKWDQDTPLEEVLTLTWFYRNGEPMPVSDYPENGSMVILREKPAGTATTRAVLSTTITPGTNSGEENRPTWTVTASEYGTTTLELIYWKGEGDPKPNQEDGYETILEIPVTVSNLEPSQLRLPNTVDLTNHTTGHGYVLADRNMGAASPTDAGTYYSRREAFTDPCPEGWRLPTLYELRQLLSSTQLASYRSISTNAVSVLGVDWNNLTAKPMNQLVIPKAGTQESKGTDYHYWTANFKFPTNGNYKTQVLQRIVATFNPTSSTEVIGEEVSGYDQNGTTDPDVHSPVRCIADETPYVWEEYKEMQFINKDLTLGSQTNITGFYELPVSDPTSVTQICPNKVINSTTYTFLVAESGRIDALLKAGLLPDRDKSNAKIAYVAINEDRITHVITRTYYGYFDVWQSNAGSTSYRNVWGKYDSNYTTNTGPISNSKWYVVCYH